MKSNHLMHEHSMLVKDFGNDLMNSHNSQLNKSTDNPAPLNASRATQFDRVAIRKELKLTEKALGSGGNTPGHNDLSKK